MDIYSQGMRDRSMRSGAESAREIKVTDWSMAGNLSNRSSGVQIPRDICTRLKHRGILHNEAEVFSLSITNHNGRPMLPFDWLIHLSLLASCHKIFVFVRCRFSAVEK